MTSSSLLKQALSASRDVIISSHISLTEAPLPDPTPTPPNTLKRTRNGAKRTRNGPKSSSLWWDGRGVCRDGGGGGGCKGKRKSLHLFGNGPNTGEKLALCIAAFCVAALWCTKRPCLELIIVPITFRLSSSYREDYWNPSESHRCQ